MGARYALYYAPDTDSALWQRASRWLGRDAATGEDVAQFVPDGLEPDHFAALTAAPRHYGFHATLKAPFQLADERSEGQLLAAVEKFAVARMAFTATIAPQILGNFIAFRLVGASAEMHALHRDCVCDLDNFRAQPSALELERRRKATLSAEQDERLVKWGYPYIFEDFRFHMTLSGRVDAEVQRRQLLDAATSYFTEDCGVHRFASLCVFHQPDAASPFTIIGRFAFGA
ncbi:MAG: DUF1045 domain-containing protein [Alphaproteobacteria bacterium]|nr:DUF1045 domain-containing protein [Alphaproteobacteria bacterium]